MCGDPALAPTPVPSGGFPRCSGQLENVFDIGMMGRFPIRCATWVTRTQGPEPAPVASQSAQQQEVAILSGAGAVNPGTPVWGVSEPQDPKPALKCFILRSVTGYYFFRNNGGWQGTAMRLKPGHETRVGEVLGSPEMQWGVSPGSEREARASGVRKAAAGYSLGSLGSRAEAGSVGRSRGDSTPCADVAPKPDTQEGPCTSGSEEPRELTRSGLDSSPPWRICFYFLKTD